MDQSLEKALRPLRKPLVNAAEGVMREVYSGGQAKVNKAQLTHLIIVCGEAACAEEIANYIRYQSSRKAIWDFDHAQKTIDAVTKIVDKLDDRVRVEAWRLYATYLARAFTYEEAVAKAKDAAAKPNAGKGGRP